MSFLADCIIRDSIANRVLNLGVSDPTSLKVKCEHFEIMLQQL